MQPYHMRITSAWSLIQSGFIAEFLKKFSPNRYVFSEEVSTKGVIHVHGHIEYTDKVPPSSTLSDLFKRHLLSGKNYHKPLKKDIKNNLLYVFKDLDVKMHNFSETEYDSLIEETNVINDDKKKNTRDKLFELYRTWFYIQRPKCEWTTTTINDFGDEVIEEHEEVCEYGEHLWSLTAIAMFINNLYVMVWKKEPPLAHLNGYVLYIATLMNNEIIILNSRSRYYDINSFYDKRY